MPTVDVASSLPSGLFSARPDAKGAIRDRVRQRRRLISPADRGAAAAAVVAVVAESGLLPVTPGIVAGYWPVGSELDCRPLLHGLDAAGWGCVLPVVVGATLALRFRSWRPGQPLETGGWRIPEPAASAPDIIPTVVLVPMVAFDRAGHRLGQGGGHYDRTLAALRSRGSVLAVGLAFAVQEEPALPAEPHDQPLDWLVTENGALRVGRA